MNDKNIANPNTFKTFEKEHRTTAGTPPTISQLPKNKTAGANK